MLMITCCKGCSSTINIFWMCWRENDDWFTYKTKKQQKTINNSNNNCSKLYLNIWLNFFYNIHLNSDYIACNKKFKYILKDKTKCILFFTTILLPIGAVENQECIKPTPTPTISTFTEEEEVTSTPMPDPSLTVVTPSPRLERLKTGKKR